MGQVPDTYHAWLCDAGVQEFVAAAATSDFGHSFAGTIYNKDKGISGKL